MSKDLIGGQASVYRVWRNHAGVVELAELVVVKETPKLWIMGGGDPAVGCVRNVGKELDFLHRTPLEAMRAFDQQCQDDLKAAHAAVDRAERDIHAVGTMIAKTIPLTPPEN